MFARKKIFTFLLLCLLLNRGDSFAEKILSPEEGKFADSARRPSGTAEERFSRAMKLFENEKYRRALPAFRKIIKSHPDTVIAAEAKYHAAVCLGKMSKYYHAFKMYQQVLEQYPFNERLDEIIEQQYLLGEIYFKKKKYDRAREIFEKLLINSPFSKMADVAQYKAGMSHFKLSQYREARDAFDKIPEMYSYSPYLDSAVFHSALCSFRISSRSKHYDMRLLRRAADELQYFMRRYPASDFVPQAKILLDELFAEKAKKMFRTAQFYEKQNKQYAALLYYEQVAFDFEQTDWGKQARIKLQTLRH